MRGAGLLAFLLLVLGMTGCGSSREEIPDAELERARALGLPSGARLYRVTLGGRGAREHVVPTLITVRPGDGVEFFTADHRVHTVTFLPDSLTPAAHVFLESSGQLRSPPLVARGTRFILRFQDAPPGRYPFVSEGHGGTAHGVVVVEDPRGPFSSGGADIVESGRSITHKEFDEVIRRAAEVAASEPDAGEATLTELDLFRIAQAATSTSRKYHVASAKRVEVRFEPVDDGHVLVEMEGILDRLESEESLEPPPASWRRWVRKHFRGVAEDLLGESQ